MASPATPPFRVRPAVMADLPAMVDLLVAVAAEARWIGAEVVDREQRHADLLARVADPGAATVSCGTPC